MKADEHFPICVGACGRRGGDVVWYQVSDSVRFGECLRCYGDREMRAARIEAISGPWDPPPEEPTGPDEDRSLPWSI